MRRSDCLVPVINCRVWFGSRAKSSAAKPRRFGRHAIRYCLKQQRGGHKRPFHPVPGRGSVICVSILNSNFTPLPHPEARAVVVCTTFYCPSSIVYLEQATWSRVACCGRHTLQQMARIHKPRDARLRAPSVPSPPNVFTTNNITPLAGWSQRSTPSPAPTLIYQPIPTSTA